MPEINCTFCNALVHKSSYTIKRAQINFCSCACHGSYNRAVRITDGYRTLKVNGKRLKEHRLVMEAAIGRRLLPTEHVHHRDGNRLNNSLSNLVVLSQAAHNYEHFPLTWDLERAKAMWAEGADYYKIGKALGVRSGCIRSTFIRRGLHIQKSR